MGRPGALRRRLLLCAMAVLLSLLAAELLLRLLPLPGRQPDLPGLFLEADARLGWRHRRDVRGVVDSAEFHHEVAYNERGMRGAVRPYAKPAGTRRVVLLGDSFLDGYSVPLAARVDVQLEAMLNADGSPEGDGPFEVIAFGTPGYSTDQELLVLRDEALRYEPDLVVLLFYDNDVVFNGRREFSLGPKPRFRWEDGALILEPVAGSVPEGVDAGARPSADVDTTAETAAGARSEARPPRATGARFRAACRHSRLYRWLSHAIKASPDRMAWLVRHGLAQAPGELLTPVQGVQIPAEFLVYLTPAPAEIEDSWRLTEALLAEMRRTLAELQVPLLIAYVPPRAALDDGMRRAREVVYGLDRTRWDFTVVGPRLRRACTEHGWPWLDLGASFPAAAADLYFPADGHWNADGHRAAARALRDWIVQRPSWR